MFKGVNYAANVFVPFLAACTDGDVRLVNGSSPSEGLVETCNGSQWFQVCDEGWTSNDAEVVCRQLGYTTFCKLPAPFQD